MQCILNLLTSLRIRGKIGLPRTCIKHKTKVQLRQVVRSTQLFFRYQACYLPTRSFNQSRQHTLKAYCPIIYTVYHFRHKRIDILDEDQLRQQRWYKRKAYEKLDQFKVINYQLYKIHIFVKFSTNSLTNTILTRLYQMSICCLSFMLRNQNWNLHLQPKFFRSCQQRHLCFLCKVAFNIAIQIN